MPTVPLGLALLGRAVDQREQGEASAFALIVRAHDDRDIFQGHDDHHRPEDQAEHAVDVERVRGERVMPGKGLAKSVDRRRPDIAEDDADGADHQLGNEPWGWCPDVCSPVAELRQSPASVMLI